MLAGIRLQQLAKVGTTRTQDDLVGGKGPLLAGNRHIDKVLLVPQMPEGRQYRRLEVIPFECILLLFGWCRRKRPMLVLLFALLLLLVHFPFPFPIALTLSLFPVFPLLLVRHRSRRR